RELLDVNPVFQPANLALRNAWFSGGVEWNIGTTGHSPFTCSPLFAARVTSSDGFPVLRMYEWERLRQVPFQIDAYLPDGSPVLFVCIRIVNPHSQTMPMYWWSNIAVPETSRTRVVVPAMAAYSFGYGGQRLARVPTPVVDGVDVTYPTNIDRAADFFFEVPEGAYPWITALDENGRGLIQSSTARLKGRKLFLWGQGEGGRRWQTFLAEPGHAYIEIQAGLARTQLEHLPMPAGATWTWVEAYGLIEADATVVHGPDWHAAVAEVQHRLDDLAPASTLQAELARASGWLDRKPSAIIQRGSGWGALERIRREGAGLAPFCSEGLVFDGASLTGAQAPWLSLLETGMLPVPDPLAAPEGFVVASHWRQRLEQAAAGDSGNWFAWLHLGVMRYAHEDVSGAEEAWRRSLDAAENPWASRNLAVVAADAALAADEGSDARRRATDAAVAAYTRAVRLAPDLLPLLIESGQRLLDLGQAAAWLPLLDAMPAHLRSKGRIRLLEGRAALQVGDLARVAQLFDGSLVVDDLREGERSLSQIWFDYHAQRISQAEQVPVDDALMARVRRECPVPPALDFRMSAET
ncbi:MAG: DUF5107 domain-containing protein, partial [Anaerolineae bacterium]|nr:DUF5107 domain-containing protein [Anaerolineae bacterium]